MQSLPGFDKYQVARKVYSHDFCKFLGAGLLISEQRGLLIPDKTQVKNSNIIYSCPYIEALLLMTLESMIRITGKRLLPTYSFARIYRRGDRLEKHTDRPACQYSASLTLDYISNKKWPIYVGKNEAIILDRGDLLVYEGCNVEHWRDSFDGDLWIQVFLHYVDSDDKYVDHSFDKRELNEFYDQIFSNLSDATEINLSKRILKDFAKTLDGAEARNKNNT